jgi:hypothetical protein
MGLVWLEGMPVGATAYWLVRISGRTIIYSFSYLGIVMFASQVARTPIRAGGLALVIMFVCSMTGGLLKLEPIASRAPGLFGALSTLFPNGHHLHLWHPDLLPSGIAMFALISIGLAWFGLGFWFFSRRDA